MLRRLLASLLAVVVVGSWATAQGPKLRWTAGQVLLYRVELSTVALDQVGENKSETKSVVKVTKRWQVTKVETDGTATLTLSLTQMYQQRTTPSNEVLTYDSANPDKSDPHLKKALEAYVNKPLATLRIDPQGRVVEIKESISPATSYENELPFLALLPAAAFKAGLTWERPYKITLPPPLGTGEKYDAVQKYGCKAATAEAATVTLTTELKNPPKAAADAIPLWQMMPAGEIVYDLKNGRLHSAKLTIEREVKGHQGENSVCKFTSSQTVQYVEK
jgi:hypothetical protein